MARTDEEPLEALLRQTFADARDGVGTGPGLDAVRTGAFARATRLRRRRAALQGAGATGLVAAAVLALVVGTGPFGVGARLAPAGPSAVREGGAGSVRAWQQLVPGTGSFAYRFPDALPGSPPAGLIPLTLGPEVVTPGSPTVPAPGAAKQLSFEDADLVGVAGVCAFDAHPDRRQPVAGRTWQFASTSHPGSYAAGLGLVGFTTGTGLDAMIQLRELTLPCLPQKQLKYADWNGGGVDSVLFTGADKATPGRHLALAVVLVGDVLVGGSARADGAAEATRVATALARQSAQQLVSTGFPPALGKVLGSSASAPNDASAPGASAQVPVLAAPAYEIGDVFPTADQLGHGLAYHGDALTGTGTPAAPGAQVCDLSGFADRAEREAKPGPVAGAQRDAWAGDGNGPDPSVTFSVTGWAKGTGAARFAELQQDRGRCAWMPDQQRDTWMGQDPATTWLSHSTAPGHTAFLASRRVGDLIVSVVVSNLPADQARAEAVRLNGILTAGVASSGLPAAKGR
ncbi:hypothetical protein GCM10027517_24710 [Phycicoccus ginsengisoli]